MIYSYFSFYVNANAIKECYVVRRLGLNPGSPAWGPEQYECIHIVQYERASKLMVSKGRHKCYYLMVGMKRYRYSIRGLKR